MYENNVGVLVPKVMLPPKGTDFSKWAVVACDQFTSQPEYWQQARAYIGDAPSPLDLILPEAYLGSPDEPERISLLPQSVFRDRGQGAFADHISMMQPLANAEGMRLRYSHPTGFSQM